MTNIFSVISKTFRPMSEEITQV